MQVKLMVAGPGTGKTTKVKEIVRNYNPDKVLVVSFTNATIDDLLVSFKEKEIDITSRNCMTLHKLALRLNHLPDVHILNDIEDKYLRSLSKSIDVNYETFLRLVSSINFSEMIRDCTAFISTNPTFVREKLGDIDLLIVDEFQDFNTEERDLIFGIANLSKETLILCDDDQCIYGFKNADSEGVIDLFNDADVTKISSENTCYRCPEDVVVAINNLVRNNKNRIPKELTPGKQMKGLSFSQTKNQEDTNNYVIEKIKRYKKAMPDSSIMILSNVGFVSEPLIQAFKDNDIDHTNWWLNKFDLELMQRIWEIKLIFGKNKILNLMFLSQIWSNKNPGRKKKIVNLISGLINSGEDVQVVFDKLMKLGIVSDRLILALKNLPNILTFIKNNPDYQRFADILLDNQDLERSLERLELNMNENIKYDKSKVNVMSIHKSKGLQADIVFILGLVEGLLPNEAKAIDSIEAQRRVLFVGMSRAKEKLHLISQIVWPTKFIYKVDKTKFKHKNRNEVVGKTSSFISELRVAL